MAEVSQDSGGGGKHSKGPKQKKKSTKVDMTAMVDVAFLLLTFFILTTTMATPKAMMLSKPPKETDEQANTKEVAESKVMTIILGENNNIFYYVGITEPKIEITDFSDKGVRKVITDHLNKFPNRCGKDNTGSNCWDPIFVIKPNRFSKYKNVVDILDEMYITGASKYALADVTPQDSIFLAEQNLR